MPIQKGQAGPDPDVHRLRQDLLRLGPAAVLKQRRESREGVCDQELFEGGQDGRGGGKFAPGAIEELIEMTMASLTDPNIEQGLGTTLIPLRLEYMKELVRTGDAGRAAWQAFHAGARFAYSGLWRDARRSMRSRVGAARGGKSKRGYRELNPNDVLATIAALRKQNPRLRKPELDQRAGRAHGISARTVRRFRSGTGV